MKEQAKYIMNRSGLPIRLAPYLRSAMREGDPTADTQIQMIRSDPYATERAQEDTLPHNINENIRLRRIARLALRELVTVAQDIDAKRYCTIVHGSLSKGLIRHPSNPDPSDIDMALVIDGVDIARDKRLDISKNATRNSPQLYGVKVDIHIWTIDEVKKDHADLARTFLRSAAYPLANHRNLWEEIQWLGTQCHLLLSESKSVRKKIRQAIKLIASGQTAEKTMQQLARGDVGYFAGQYLQSNGYFENNAQQKAMHLGRAIGSINPLLD